MSIYRVDRKVNSIQEATLSIKNTDTPLNGYSIHVDPATRQHGPRFKILKGNESKYIYPINRSNYSIMTDVPSSIKASSEVTAFMKGLARYCSNELADFLRTMSSESSDALKGRMKLFTKMSKNTRKMYIK